MSAVFINKHCNKIHTESQFTNSQEDNITIINDIVGIRLECKDCKDEIHDSIDFWEEGYDFNIYERDERLTVITKALFKISPKIRKYVYQGEGKIKEMTYIPELPDTEN